MILHGGSNGELNKYGLEDQHVFQWTQNQLETQIDLGEGQCIPTLEALILICLDSPNMLLNIELKGPLDEEWVSQYDYNLAAQKVIELIDRYKIARRVMISSFVQRILDSIIAASTPARKFIIQSLRNRGFKPDPADYEIFDQTTGINMMLQYMTVERVSRVRNNGGLIGLWYYAPKDPNENHEMWSKVFTICGGVDFFFSDKPVQAM